MKGACSKTPSPPRRGRLAAGAQCWRSRAQSAGSGCTGCGAGPLGWPWRRLQSRWRRVPDDAADLREGEGWAAEVVAVVVAVVVTAAVASAAMVVELVVMVVVAAAAVTVLAGEGARVNP